MIRNADILVVDDEESMRDSCLQTLSRKGYNVETAENGSIGLEIMKKKIVRPCNTRYENAGS